MALSASSASSTGRGSRCARRTWRVTTCSSSCTTRSTSASVRRAPDDLIAGCHCDGAWAPATTRCSRGCTMPSALVTGASVDAARAVWEGTSQHAVNLSGVLHHAMRDRASGFCVYDDPAVAIAWLLQAGATNVAYVDVDVHHGDGVEAAFWDDPRVLTVSMHESGRTLFPGTGWADQVGWRCGGRLQRQRRAADGPPATRVGCGRSTPSYPPSCALRPAGDGDPARLRHPRARPARAPADVGRRPADGLCATARPGPRALRREVGRARRRWLRAGAGRAPRVDAPARRGDRRRRRRRDSQRSGATWPASAAGSSRRHR